MQEFIDNNNIQDLKNILIKRFRNIHEENDIEDIIQDFCTRAMASKTIEKFDESRGVKFSTYMFRCFQNFLLAFYYRKTNKELVNYEAMSIDALLNNSDVSINDYLSCEEVDLDLELFKKEIHELLLSTKKTRSNIDYVKLYELILEGFNDSEIAKIENLSSTRVAMIKRDMLNILKKKLKITDFN
jgi:DNA-directed RNA polymerase specialized sigma24 family protein